MNPSDPQRSVGDALIECLESIGAKVCFGVPGGQTIPLYAAARRTGFRHVLMRDERNAACAADAYARVSGRIGVCDATVGPGATNLVSGLAEAYASAIPVLAIVADVKTEREHLRVRGVASQAMEQQAMLQSVTKRVSRVHTPTGLRAVFSEAVRTAVTGRAGPVALEIPEDIFFAPAAAQPPVAADPDGGRWPRYGADPGSEDIASAAQMLAEAERPLILAGGGALSSREAAEVVALAERHSIPVVTSINGKGVIDEHHPLARGVVGVFGAVEASVALRQADVVLVLGSKFAQFNSFLWRLPSAAQRLIHVDSDGGELGRAIPASLAICADAGRTARRLREALDDRAPRPAWRIDPADCPGQPGTPDTDPRVAPEQVVAALSERADEGTILVSDASLASGWTASRYRVRGSGRLFLAPRGLAGIGWAGGAAIGAAFAQRERPGGRIVAVSGDGATSYWIGEVETAVRHQLPIIFVILNNAGFGWIMQGEKMLDIHPRSTFGPVDFAAMGRAMGARGYRAETIDEAIEAIDEAWTEQGPVVIDILTSEDASPSVDWGSIDPSAVSAFGAYGMG
ncbi:thiamine pyrophosphate-binding protein [Sphingopyxis sp. DBS4]|uniref:thiamine pyrophosphate-binding protein n=1 Tax=Sphingopyxis sp. DBS4 TaxID=2968500 RepID=UPI00214BAF0B|nr:thiamine pyrophosphate-binding protein [Sphingopyxis sp. DBS4]